MLGLAAGGRVCAWDWLQEGESVLGTGCRRESPCLDWLPEREGHTELPLCSPVVAMCVEASSLLLR